MNCELTKSCIDNEDSKMSKNIYLLYDYSAQTTQIKKKKLLEFLFIHCSRKYVKMLKKFICICFVL